NDEAIARRPEERRESPDRGELAAPIDREYPVDEFIVETVEVAMRHGLGEARAVHQNVEAREIALDRRSQRDERSGVGDIGRKTRVPLAGKPGDDRACSGFLL